MRSPFSSTAKSRPASVAAPYPSNGAAHTSSTQCRDGSFYDPSVVRWLHSAGLQHLASSLPEEHCLRPRNSMQNSSDQSTDPSKPLKIVKNAASNPARPSSGVSLSKKGSNLQEGLTLESRHNSGPETLDAHAINTELLSEDATTGRSSRCSKFCSPRRAQSSKMELSSRPATADPEVRENQTAKIKVVVRKRPINKKEVSRHEEDIITVAQDGCLLTVHETKLKVDLTAYVEKHEFVFDAILDESVTNDEVYLETVKPIIPALFQQTKATCFAYGQTGSGKTFTMEPLPFKASEAILHLMQQPSYHSQGFQLWLSYFEIYGGKLFDLLNGRRKLCMREDGRQQVCIVGLKEFQIFDLVTLKNYIERGSCSRSTGSTGANEESSRSHAILQLTIKRSYGSNDKRRLRMAGKLSFIDLAGSERGADTTDNDRQTRLEGAEINKSLLALKECIRALDSDQSHIPFRGSKLTEVLRDSFVGNSRTVMISCISPSSGSCEHTLNTLRYADRVKGLSKNSNAKRDPCSASSQPESCMSPPQTYIRHALEKSEEPPKSDIMHFPSRPHTASAQMVKDFKQDLSSKDRGSADEFHAAESTDCLDRRQRGKHLVSASTFLKGEKVSEGQKQETKTSLLKSNLLTSGSTCVNQSISSEKKMSSLSKEEDYLVSAHCRELEDTINFIREEMKLLAEVDQPGSQINHYVSQLSKVLSRKAEGLVGLQARLARFKQLLKEQEVLEMQAA